MQPGIYIEMNVLSSMVCILLYYQQKRHKVFDFLGTTAFNSLLWASVAVMLVDIASWFLMGELVPPNDTALMIVQSIYYIAQAILPMFFMVYCVAASGRRVSGIWHILMYLPVLFTAAVIVVNLETHFAFYVVDNTVLRGGGFLAAIVTPMIYLLFSLGYCFVFYLRGRRESVERRKIAFHMLICVILCFLGAAVCVFVNYISPWHVFVAALIYLYMQLHSYREHTLDEQASTDSLTGLKNHAVYTHIKERMDDDLREGICRPFAVVVMDINDLKPLNDVYGHKAGDQLIISASKVFCDVFSRSPVCRIGGDEFVAVLERSDYDNRSALADEFRARIGQTTFTVEEHEFPVSAALGLAEFRRERHTSFEDVFHAADEAMYRDKEAIKRDRNTRNS